MTYVKLLLASVCFLLTISAQAAPAYREYVSSDRAFAFRHSTTLLRCAETEQEHWWDPVDCNSQGGICEDYGIDAKTIVCFAYPKKEFAGKPAFSTAAVYVAIVKDAFTADVCLSGSSNWLSDKPRGKTINGIKYNVFLTGDNWAGGGQGGDIYRTFHRGTCYEIGTLHEFRSTGAFDPGTFEEYTTEDRAKVNLRLNEPVKSFRFLK